MLPVMTLRPTPLRANANPPTETTLPELRFAECPVCFHRWVMGDKIMRVPCPAAHCFHARCIGHWLTQHDARCPICVSGNVRAHFNLSRPRVLPSPLLGTLAAGCASTSPGRGSHSRRARRCCRHLRRVLVLLGQAAAEGRSGRCPPTGSRTSSAHRDPWPVRLRLLLLPRPAPSGRHARACEVGHQ